MKKLALITAALLAGTALAAAQGMNPQQDPAGGNKTERAAPAPSAQKKAPAEKMAPRAQNGAKKETTGQAPKAGADVKAGADTKAGAATKAADTKAGASGKAGANAQMKAQDDKAGAAGKNKAAQGKAGERDNKATAQGKAGEKNGKASAQTERKGKGKEATTGQGAAGSRGAANLSTEQKTKIRTVIREKVKVKPVEHVNFSVSIGTVVPRSIRYYPLPAEVVTIYPAWRGYYFILVGTRIVVIQPSSFEIVAVLA